MAAVLVSYLNSFVVDYVLRQKSSGSNLNFYVLRQLPGIPIDRLKCQRPWTDGESVFDWMIQRAARLSYTTESLRDFGEACGIWDGPMVYDETERFLLKAELDAAWFVEFGLTRQECSMVLDAFDVLKRKEMKRFGDYLSKQRVLECYDDLLDRT